MVEERGATEKEAAYGCTIGRGFFRLTGLGLLLVRRAEFRVVDLLLARCEFGVVDLCAEQLPVSEIKT